MIPLENESGALASDIVCDELKNGMKVLVKQVYPSSVINFSVWVRVGAVHETPEIAGLSHFIEHMLFKGTPKRPLGEIAREIYGCGGYMNAFTDYECTCYWVVLPSKYLDVALDVQADAFLHSLFDPAEIEKECLVILEELKMYQDRPEAFAFEKLLNLSYKKHPYGRPIIGYEQTLRNLKRGDFLGYFSQYYKAGNMFVTLVGDVVPSRAIRKIKETFNVLPEGKAHKNLLDDEPVQQEFRQQEYEGDIARGNVMMGFHMPSAIHKDSYALRVLAGLLGTGRSARLNQTLREKFQWIDGADAGVFAQSDPGLFYIGLTLDQKNVKNAEEVLWKEIQKLQNSLVSHEELVKIQNMIESETIFSQETVEGQARNLGYYEILGDYRWAEKFLPKLFEVTPDDVRKVAQKYLTRENCSQILYRH